MKRTLRYGLLAGASGLALGVGLATAPAQAFDEVDWTWTSDITTDFTIDPEIVWTVDPEGLVMVESIQVSVGDISASSTVSGVHNNQPEGTGYADGSFTFESEIFDDDSVDGLDFNKGVYGGETSGEVAGIQPGAQTDSTFGSTDDSGDVGDLDSGVYDATGALDGATVSVHGGIAPTGGSCNNETGEEGCVIFTVDIEDMYIIGDAALDAVVELPEVVSVATAVANNLTVTADAGTMMHNGQYAFGEFNAPEEGEVTYAAAEFEKEWEYWYKDIGRRGVSLGGGEGSLSGSGEYFNASGDLANVALAAAGISQVDTGNRHHDVLATATILAQLGLISKGTVEAESDVSDILNASVDSNATAVSNNISVSVNPAEEVEGEDGEMVSVAETTADNLLVADYTQFSYMDVNSTSSVSDVEVNNYVNLGAMDRPLVNSTATSVGNNISVNVGN
ncbi:hypothetical protein [Fodinicurvata fenggangensis]|uniref:hypothetical protein n=1 Tax=Fodinicurvata fenggangensis TaxID=1121830 RepID=UPI00047B63F2|nr:hypothetical protein [Fodinicurvata fenggangensis]